MSQIPWRPALQEKVRRNAENHHIGRWGTQIPAPFGQVIPHWKSFIWQYNWAGPRAILPAGINIPKAELSEKIWETIQRRRTVFASLCKVGAMLAGAESPAVVSNASSTSWPFCDLEQVTEHLPACSLIWVSRIQFSTLKGVFFFLSHPSFLIYFLGYSRVESTRALGSDLQCDLGQITSLSLHCLLDNILFQGVVTRIKTNT